MKKKYLVVMKNPPSTFMVDGYTDDKFLKKLKMASFIQEGLSLWIPISIDSNIAYIQEMTNEEIEEFELRMEELKTKLAEARAKLLKPKFKFPPGKSS